MEDAIYTERMKVADREAETRVERKENKLSLLPALPKPKDCTSLLSVDTLCPSN